MFIGVTPVLDVHWRHSPPLVPFVMPGLVPGIHILLASAAKARCEWPDGNHRSLLRRDVRNRSAILIGGGAPPALKPTSGSYWRSYRRFSELRPFRAII